MRSLILVLLISLIPALSSAESEIVKIGWIGPLTGDVSILGVDSVEVAKQAIERANKRSKDRKFELVVNDDQYQTTKTVTAFNKMVAEGVRVFFIITYGGMLALSNRAEHDNVLLIDPLDCDEELAALPQNSFCVAKKSEDVGRLNAEHAVKNNPGPAAIIYTEGDPFKPKVANASKAVFEKAGMPVVVFEGIHGVAKDFRSILSRVKSKGARTLFLYGDDDFALALKQAHEMRLKVVNYGFVTMIAPGFSKVAGNLTEGAYAAGWSAPRTEQYAQFLMDYKNAVGREPLLEISTIPTHDMAEAIIEGIEAQSESKPLDVTQLRKYLYGLKNYKGLSGSITIDPDGAVRTLTCRMNQVRGGVLVKVSS